MTQRWKPGDMTKLEQLVTDYGLAGVLTRLATSTYECLDSVGAENEQHLHWGAQADVIAHAADLCETICRQGDNTQVRYGNDH